MRSVNLFKKMRGYVEIKITNSDHSKFLSKVLEEKISIWDTQITDDYSLTAKILPLDYKYIKQIAKKQNTKIEKTKEKGLFVKLSKMSGLISIILGLLISYLIISILSQFVWRIEMIGEENYDASNLLEIAEENGIKIGAYGKSLDLRYIEQVIMSEIDDLSWVGISKKGVNVYIDVRERVVPEKLTYNDEPCNLVAFCDGKIVEARVYKGQQLVKENYTVSKGDILASGAYLPGEDATDMIYTHATGSFIAECPVTKTFNLPLITTQKVRTNEVINRKYLSLFNIKIPLFWAKKLGAGYICEEYENEIEFYDIKMPFLITEKKYTKMAETQVDNTNNADAIMDLMISNYENEISKDCEIISKTENRSENNGIYTCQINFILKMDIAKEEIIFVK